MSKRLQAVRGMNDILPEASGDWQLVEQKWRELMQSYSYQQIRYPIVESTDLFKRTVGEATDIVEKEMYTFADRNGDNLTLRPEGTAGCIRALLEHNVLRNEKPRLWYSGPMFRHERPQKGRFRQFHQFGVEAVGFAGPDIDAEIIALSARYWQMLGISDKVSLQINSLGTPGSRHHYREKLVAYFTEHHDHLDEDSKRRLQTNPLRILDSKNSDMAQLIADAPKLIEHLDEADRVHFEGVCRLLDAAGIAYEINPYLVRGLDYYTHTVFEWVSDELGAQGTVCAGGRYNGLVEQLGGKETPAVGFALGIERLLLLCELETPMPVDVYLIHVGELASQHAFLLAEQLRDQLPQLRLRLHCGEASFKSQFKQADKSGANIALVLGDDEVANATIAIKYLREDKPQETIALSAVADFLAN